MPNAPHAQSPFSEDRPPTGGAGHCLCLNAAEGLLHLIIARQEAAGAAPLTLLCSQAWHAPSQGAELLAPALADALARLGLVPGDIRRIACVRGPGSFTGVRLTLATAAGLARTTEAEQAGIEYLPLLAYGACRRLGGLPDAHEGARPEDSASREAQKERQVWVLTHARKNLIHLQGFSVPAFRRSRGLEAFHAPTPLTDILVCPPHEAALFLRARWEEEQDASGRPVLLGSGLSRNHAAIADALALSAGHAENSTAKDDDRADKPGYATVRAPLLLPPDFDHPMPEALLDMAANLAYAPQDIEPLYVRPADAEENLERIALSLGLDPDQARAKLAAIRQPLS